MRSATIAMTALVLTTAAAAAGEAAPILDKSSFSRFHETRASYQVKRASGEVEYCAWEVGPAWNPEKLKVNKVEPRTSPPPPAGWREPDFDDGNWVRLQRYQSGRCVGEPSSLVCMRSRFEVRDPASAGELSLSLSFRGGAAVYLNGKEVARASLPVGELRPETPAEAYPQDVYLDPDGFLLRTEWGDPTTYPEIFKRRIRTLSAKLPAGLLRKGTNVLAVEVHRAPIAELYFRTKTRKERPGLWSMCALEELVLSAPAGSSAVPNTSRPGGLQVWNHPVLQPVLPTDRGDPTEPLRPVEIRGARGGVFSGLVMVGSGAAIRGLKASAGELKSAAGGALPASAVSLRYGQLDGADEGRRAPCFDGLAAEAPAEVPVDKAGGGAVQPVWIGVRIPRDAKPGAYEGAVTVSADGLAPVAVPVRLKVADWELPDPRQFAAHVGLIQSPDSVAMRYGVPPWSEEHWKLLEKSFALLGELGNDTVYLPLVRRTHFGNDHGMVRWIRQADGSWKHDFSIVECYLDLAVKHLGKPPVVAVYAWECYTGGSWAFGKGGDSKGNGMCFTALDPKTGALEEAVGPEWGTPEARAFWKPVLEGLRDILRKRGLEGSMMVGPGGDSRPSKAAVEDLKAVLPEAKWVLHTHPDVRVLHGQPVGYLCCVWGVQSFPAEGQKRAYGWANPFLLTAFPRPEAPPSTGPLYRGVPPVRYRIISEGLFVAGLRGFGRVGADFWPVLKDGQGRWRAPIVARFPESKWASVSLDLSDPALLAVGKDGAIPSVRFEMVREGLQESEARFCLERALTDPALKARLDAKLGERCQALLDERVAAMRNGGIDGWGWFVSSGWQERNERLFEAAGEVARAAGK